jgi:hypothetical protein
MSDVCVRSLAGDDADAVRALVQSQFGGTRYCSRVLELVESALTLDDAECSALVALSGDERMVGCALFGVVTGALGVVKIHALVGAETDVLGVLLDAIHVRSVQAGERMIVCELPDDEPYSRMADILTSGGFVEEGRVPDLFTDGVALRILARRS